MSYRILLIFIFSLFFALPIFAKTEVTNKIISVGISDNSFTRYYYNENSFYATDTFLVKDKNENIIKTIEKNTPINIKIKNNKFNLFVNEKLELENIESPITLETTENGLLGIVDLKRAGMPALYRGKIKLLKPACKENMFLVNNVLDLETYLRGVVPNEMPVKFGLEALKAQAVAARNYALRPREKKIHEFDVCDSVACQVYFGANTEKPLATQAVDETKGLVAQYSDKLIVALYSSTSGGYTEDYDNAFLPEKRGEHPYLKGVSDNEKIKDLSTENNAIDFYKNEPETFENDSRYFRWTRVWSVDDLTKVLKDNYLNAYKTGHAVPSINNVDDFGSILDINVLNRGVSGKVIDLEVITDKNKFKIEKELVIRRLFKNEGKTLPSANFVIEKEFTEDKKLKQITFVGGGYGHGVGLSQYGAGGMAKEGFSFDEILKHYYSGIEIATIPLELSLEEGKNNAKIEFFVEKKQGKIIVENKFCCTELDVIINGKQFKLKVQPNLNKKYSIDISQYLNIGENKVYLFYPLSDNKGKPIKVYIELYGKTNDK